MQLDVDVSRTCHCLIIVKSFAMGNLCNGHFASENVPDPLALSMYIQNVYMEYADNNYSKLK